ncbi:hypothetical protein M405DRAFT_507520 [Rhizopogon salebrosus TDB-379]|nr:hypothetical protein M405DRAFT_507520 [Rhizopogon salebrosus TDB-379]
MFELIATGSSPLSGVHNNLALSALSNSSPTAVTFVQVVPCITTTLYLSALTTLATAACSTCSQCHPPLPMQAQSRRLPCLSIPDHKHTSPPQPHPPLRRHPSRSWRGGSSVDECSSFPDTRIVKNRDQVFGLRCAADGERAAEPSSIPVNTDLRSPHSPAVTRLRAWTANDGRTIKAFATAWCRAWLGEGTVCQLIRV